MGLDEETKKEIEATRQDVFDGCPDCKNSDGYGCCEEHYMLANQKVMEKWELAHAQRCKELEALNNDYVRCANFSKVKELKRILKIKEQDVNRGMCSAQQTYPNPPASGAVSVLTCEDMTKIVTDCWNDETGCADTRSIIKLTEARVRGKCRAEMDAKDEHIEAAGKRIVELEKENADLKNDVCEKVELLGTDMGEMQDRIDQKEKEMDALRKENTEMETLRRENTELYSRIKELEEKDTRIRALEQKYDNAVKTLEAEMKINTMNMEIMADFRAKIKELEQERDELKRRVNEHDN